MKKLDIFVLFLLSILVTTGVAYFENAPGYMDAEYYYNGGIALGTGQGFTENILWNYLDAPKGIPHPSHTYWMPLASIVAAAGPAISGKANFPMARLPFLVLSGFIPALTATLAFQLHGRRFLAFLSGLLAVFPGFYLAYYPTTDTFVLYILLGGMFLLLLGGIKSWTNGKSYLPFVGLGLIAGLMHLSRADGILWLFLGLGVAIIFSFRSMDKDRLLFKTLIPVMLVAGGYLLVMGPWMARNLAVSGSLLSPGGLRSIWITNYDELYSYPASQLTFSHWWSSGLPAMLTSRWQALIAELKTALGVQGEIFLAPLVILGAWNLRKDPRVQVGGIAWIFILGAMVILFPFAGYRGGFLHSGAALQTLWWSLAPVGLIPILSLGTRLRNWKPERALKLFGPGLVVIAVIYTGVVAYQMVFGNDPTQPAWNSTWAAARQAEKALQTAGAEVGAIAMVNNPPGFTAANGRPSIAIPNERVEVIWQAGVDYDAKYLVLEKDHPQSLEGLYQKPGTIGKLIYLGTFENLPVFRIGN